MTTTKRTRGREIAQAWWNERIANLRIAGDCNAQALATDLASRIDAAIGEAEDGARQGCMLECSEDEVVQKAIAAEREALLALVEQYGVTGRTIAAAIRARGGKG